MNLLLAGFCLAGPAATAGTGDERSMCRECPFPLSIAKGTWDFPEHGMKIEIIPIDRGDGGSEVTIIVRDGADDLVAIGEELHDNSAPVLRTTLRDRDGRIMHFNFEYSFEDASLSVRVWCEACSLGGAIPTVTQLKRMPVTGAIGF